jgi:AcrR family transcriptional regulator
VARATEQDPRYQRVRAKLSDAMLALASVRPADEIAVSELTEAAGVARTTFYSHAESPARFLADVLLGDLRPALDELAVAMTRPGADYAGLWRAIYLALLQHVGRHADVYVRISADRSTVLRPLTEYFEAVAERYLDAMAPQFVGGPASELWRTMAVQQQAHNTVAVIVAWLRTGMSEPPEAVVDTYMTLAPPWQLARPDADGRIAMRPSRAAPTGGQAPSAGK